MEEKRRPYIAPHTSVTAYVAQPMLTGSLVNPGGQIDPFVFEDDEEQQP